MSCACTRISVVFAVAALLSACASLSRRDAATPLPPSSGGYLAHGLAEFEAADRLRLEKSSLPMMGGFSGQPADYKQWLRHLERAETDFRAVLDRFPGSQEAPEAQFMLGRINDHPQRNLFDVAIDEYRRTVERYPATPAAERARQRIAVLESIRQ